MLRKRIFLAMGAIAIAVAGSQMVTGTAHAANYVCPWLTADGSSSLYSSATGQGQVVCWYYGKPAPCRYNAWLNGDDWYYYQPSYGPNPSYCAARAVPA
ncbi:hypothetical protein [Herbidospora sp. RD11066]